jgi:polysaccharide pyruvyl transferase WcaK-like protein
VRLHVGHHFFGSGNIGDDLMLAGFLQAVARSGRRVGLTCCCAFDTHSQRRRFPQIDWLPYTATTRDAAIAACDAWVGVGDTPFQLSVGAWFLEHLRGELETCRRHRKPMYFVGVGVGDPQAVADERAAAVLEYASRVWARDEWSAQMLSKACGAARISPGADLAHVYLAGHSFGEPESAVVGYAMNFEDPSQFSADALCELVRTESAQKQQRWLVQEVRTLPGSEMALWAALPEPCRRRLGLRRPEYTAGSVADLLRSWGTPSHVLSSRYHAALIAAWMGARVVAVERSGKISGLVSELGITGLPTLRDAVAAGTALHGATPVSIEVLRSLADRAAASCRDLLDGLAL